LFGDVPNFYGQVPIADPDRSFKYFFTVILVRLLLTMRAGSARSTQRLIRCDYLECGDLSPLSKALTSKRTPHKKEGAEPGREALTAF